ncbi:MAG TPA: SDR family NAD(P)-dependent oxidoreductase [Kofleriaceae bacterium]|nr:SDR family NAD(P)-dependent oxidoreductase [Kofleriaceae bacterium]
MADRVVLVTGSTDGIGRHIARLLAAGGMRVLVHGRSKPKVDAALEALRGELPGAELEGVSFDLGRMSDVRRGVEQIEKLGAPQVLVNNAGIFAAERAVTSDGLEMTFAVNYVGPFLLTELLAKSLDRVVNLSSVAHTRGRIHFDDLTLANGWTGYAAYAQSKLANVMHAMELQRHHAGITAYSIHPGTVATKLLRAGFGPIAGLKPEAAAPPVARLAAGDATEPSGTYFSDGVATPPSSAARDEAARDRLWTVSMQLAKL